MKIQEITDKKVWEKFLLNRKKQSFLQSWNWGEVNKELGKKIFRLGLYDKQLNLLGICQVLKITAKRGTFLHIPYGPVFDFNEKQQFEIILNYLKKLAKQEKASFIRINPLIEDNEKNHLLFKKQGFKNAPIHLINPETSWLKDISAIEEEIMKDFKKNTRYEINRAAKMGVKIESSSDEKALNEFYKIHMDTVKRHKFIPFPFTLLQKQLEIFAKDHEIEIFNAFFENKIIASAIIVFYGQEASYHHAASLSEYNKIPASYLIQWEVVKRAKEKGCLRYNFWGIVDDNAHHPWFGLSQFKMKFGGKKEKYLHVQDYPISIKYYFNWIIEKIRKIRRGY